MKFKNSLLAPVLSVVILALANIANAFPAGGPPDSFQVGYASNLNVGDSFINITNAGTLNGVDPAGNICANVYVFSADEELDACCSCLVSPNALKSLSAKNDLISNTLTPAIPTSIVVKVVASVPANTGLNGCNNSARSVNTKNLAPGMRVWGTGLHALPTTPVTYGGTENQFSSAVLSTSELANLTGKCGFIQDDGSGFGICKSCRTGGL